MSILVYEKRLPHSKNGQWRMAAKYPHTGCMSDPGVAIIAAVVVVAVVDVCLSVSACVCLSLSEPVCADLRSTTNTKGLR